MNAMRAMGTHKVGWVGVVCVVLVATAVLMKLRDDAYLDSDAAQYLSAATNLLAGDGLSTDVIFYEEQYGHGAIPAPLTVFPPGLPLLLAGLLGIGLNPAWASFVAGLLGFCGSGLLIFLTLRRLQVAGSLALLAAAAWLFLGLGWANVLLGRAEVTYTLATLACVLLSIQAQRRSVMLLWAGSLAAASLLLRYQGLFFLVALGAWAMLPVLQFNANGIRRSVWRAAGLLWIPALVAAFLVLRNQYLTGAPGGGPIDTVRHGIEGLDLLRHCYWTLSDLTGLSIEDLFRGQLPEGLVAAGTVLLAAWLALRRRAAAPGAARPDDTGAQERRTAFAVLGLIYLGVSACALLYLAASRSGDYLQGRFLVPLVPYVLMLWALLMDRMVRSPAEARRGLLLSALCAMYGGVFLAQAEVIQDSVADIRDDRRIAVIQQALSEPYQGTTLGEYLARTVNRERPVLAESGQQLWLTLGRPVLVTTPAGFSSRVWDENAIRVLRACYRAQYVIFFPPVFDAEMPHNVNRVLFRELARGNVPPYLRTLHKSPAVELYALDIDTEGVSCPASRRTGS